MPHVRGGGERGLDVTELITVAAALGRPLAFFVQERDPAVVSRRRDALGPHQSSDRLDADLHQFATDVGLLLERGQWPDSARDPSARTPRTHAEAEQFAQKIRRRLDLGDEPLPELLPACGDLGLTVLVSGQGVSGPEGACLTVTREGRERGVAVINADAERGRQRMTLAHELGH